MIVTCGDANKSVTFGVIAEHVSAQSTANSLPEMLHMASLLQFSSAVAEMRGAEIADMHDITDADLQSLKMEPLEIKRLRRHAK